MLRIRPHPPKPTPHICWNTSKDPRRTPTGSLERRCRSPTTHYRSPDTPQCTLWTRCSHPPYTMWAFPTTCETPQIRQGELVKTPGLVAEIVLAIKIRGENCKNPPNGLTFSSPPKSVRVHSKPVAEPFLPTKWNVGVASSFSTHLHRTRNTLLTRTMK